jgi:probable phosphoglycerate mutase
MILKREFYFIRHGQTDYNLRDVKEDHPSHIPLNENGRTQAEQIEPLIASLPVKTVCFSPLERAKQTKSIITPRLNAAHREIEDLTECNFHIWQTMTELGEGAHGRALDPVLSFMYRVAKGINLAILQPGPVLIVAHGGIHWAACCIMGVKHEWAIDNCIPVHFTIDESGKWQAKKLRHGS